MADNHSKPTQTEIEYFWNDGESIYTPKDNNTYNPEGNMIDFSANAKIAQIVSKDTSIPIKVKYFVKDLEPLSVKPCEEGCDEWIDVRAAEEIYLIKDEFRLIPLGFALELPKGYEAILVPRSSTFKEWGIIQTNGIGVIDYKYRGDTDQWMMPVYYTGMGKNSRDVMLNRVTSSGDEFRRVASKTVTIPKGTRIGQFRIQTCQPKISFTTVDKLGEESRGGFGSTGQF